MANATIDQARAAKGRARAVCAAMVSVVGVGLTRIEGGYGVKVNLDAPPPPETQLPDFIDGVPIRFEVIGTIRKS